MYFWYIMSRYQSHSFWNQKDSKTSLINHSGQIIDLASEIFENKNIEVVEKLYFEKNLIIVWLSFCWNKDIITQNLLKL